MKNRREALQKAGVIVGTMIVLVVGFMTLTGYVIWLAYWVTTLP